MEARANEGLGAVVTVARWSTGGCAHLETANRFALDVIAARVILLAWWCGRYVNMQAWICMVIQFAHTHTHTHTYTPTPTTVTLANTHRTCFSF